MNDRIDFSCFNNSNVLITGATGLVGSHLVKKLLQGSTAKVFALSRSADSLAAQYDEYIDDRLYIIKQNVCEKIVINEDVDYIFHGAGPISGDVIRNYPVDVISANIKGLANCCDIAKKQISNSGAGPRIIVFSSVTVYGDPTDDEVVVREDDILNNIDIQSVNACYSESKRMSEVMINSMIRQYGLDAVICRFSYIYGEVRNKPNIAIYQFIDSLKNENEIVMNNSGLPKRDYIYIDDVISALCVIAKDGRTGETYNVCSAGDKDNYVSIDEIADKMVSVTNKHNGANARLTYRNNAGNAKSLNGIRVDNSKLKSLGWSIKNNLEDGITKMLQYYNVI